MSNKPKLSWQEREAVRRAKIQDNNERFKQRNAEIAAKSRGVTAEHNERLVELRTQRAEMKAAWQPHLIVTYTLYFTLGLIGAHRYYLGYWRSGLLWTFTLGLFGVGWLMDALWIPTLYNRRTQGDWRID